MKNFLLFGGEIYYAGGGMEDFIKDLVFAGYGSPMEDRTFTDRPFSEIACVQWWHIFDMSKGLISAKSEAEPH
jgi:hypothetical protein